MATTADPHDDDNNNNNNNNNDTAASPLEWWDELVANVTNFWVPLLQPQQQEQPPPEPAAASGEAFDQEHSSVGKDESDQETDRTGSFTTHSTRSSRPTTVKWPDGTTKYRKWLDDRVSGTSRYNGEEYGHPPCFLCYVPIPVRWLADWIEQNQFLERIGRIGCVDPDSPRLRRTLFIAALACNFASLLLTFLAALAITVENYDLLRVLSFSRGIFKVNHARGVPLPDSQVDLGLRSVALLNHEFAQAESIWEFEDFCDTLDEFHTDVPNIFMTPDQCHECSQASFPIIFSLSMSMIFTFPSITTNFLRMWPNYDVNCQKFFGAVVGMISLLFSCYSWYAYTRDCFYNFSDGMIILQGKANVTLVDEWVKRGPNVSILDTTTSSKSNIFITPENEDDFIFVEREWEAGLGLICVVAASLVKVIDSICNWMVPTPSITRDHSEQRAYEFLAVRRRSNSAFDRLQEQHRNREVHTGLELRSKREENLSVKELHQLLGIPDPSEHQGELDEFALDDDDTQTPALLASAKKLLPPCGS